jgi:predicted dithiol-disulfide oxidoreductase (DUF899 family)
VGTGVEVAATGDECGVGGGPHLALPWVSSLGSDFNYDFHVTLDANVAPVEYNYRPKAEMLARKTPQRHGR